MGMGSRRVVAAVLGMSLVTGGVAVAAGPPGASSRQVTRGNLKSVTSPVRSVVPPQGVAKAVPAATQRARRSLRAALGRQAMLTVDERTGGVKEVGRLDGFL